MRFQSREVLQKKHEESLTIPVKYTSNVWILTESGGGSPKEILTKVNPDSIDDSRMDDSPTVPRFLVLAKPSKQGGMGSVYEAFDLKTRMQVIIKAAKRDNGNKEKLQKEAMMMAKIESGNPHIIHPLHFFPTTEIGPLLVMKRMDPETQPDLNTYINQEGRIDIHTTLHILTDIADAIDYMSENDILHFDIKPGNIYFDTKSRHAYLSDFGISAKTDNLDFNDFGAPAFTSPERVIGKDRPDIRSEVFSLASTAFFLITGEKLFAGGDAVEVILNIVAVEATEAVQQKITQALKKDNVSETQITNIIRVFNKALQKKKEDRHNSAGEFVHALDAALHTSKKSAQLRS